MQQKAQPPASYLIPDSGAAPAEGGGAYSTPIGPCQGAQAAPQAPRAPLWALGTDSLRERGPEPKRGRRGSEHGQLAQCGTRRSPDARGVGGGVRAPQPQLWHFGDTSRRHSSGVLR